MPKIFANSNIKAIFLFKNTLLICKVSLFIGVVCYESETD